MSRPVRLLSTINEYIGRMVSWLAVLLVVVVCYDTGMRYVFRSGAVALQEFEWHLYALLFLFGAAYTLKHDAHVRVDMLYQNFSPRARAWVDIVGGALFLLPFCALVIYTSLPFVYNAWLHGEGSPDPGGLPLRFLLKGAIPIGFALLVLQGVAEIGKNLGVLRNGDATRPSRGELS